MAWSTPTVTSASVSGATLTINRPGTPAAGDLLVAIITVSAATFGNITSITGTGSWTPVYNLTNPNSSTFNWTYVAYKVATGSEPASYAFTDSGGRSIVAQGAIAWYSGNASTSPLDQSAIGWSASLAIGSSPFTLTAGSVTNGTAGDLELAIYLGDTAAGGILTIPGTLTSRYNTVDANQEVLGFGEKVQTSSGATPTYAGTVSWTSGTAELGWVVVTFKPIPGPTINTQPTNQTVYMGNAATFTVSATTSGGALSYQWKYSSGGAYSNCTLGSGITAASFTTANTNNAEAANGYNYECVVTDSNGNVTTNPAQLTVIGTGVTAWLT